MKKRRFLVTKTFSTPMVMVTGSAAKPHKVEYKTFRTGETIVGDVKVENGRPVCVIVGGRLIVPMSVIKEVYTKDRIISNAEGEKKEEKITIKSGGKFKYIDAAIVGGILGFAVNWYAEKKMWIPMDRKNKFIAIALGAAATAYLIYRFSDKTTIDTKTEITK